MFIVGKLFRLIFNCKIILINPQMHTNYNLKLISWDD